MKLLERNPPRVLFADDDPTTIDLFRFYVRSLGWIAEYCTTAREILETIEAAKPKTFDAVVCDVNFFDEKPGEMRVTGVTAARVIREIYPDMPIVFVTGYTSHFVRDAVADVGGELFAKPVDWTMLFDRIAYLVRWNRLVSPPSYTGQERRSEAINKTSNQRRRADHVAAVPAELDKLISEIRDERSVRPRTNH